MRVVIVFAVGMRARHGVGGEGREVVPTAVAAVAVTSVPWDDGRV
jgi:hypothetical protein